MGCQGIFIVFPSVILMTVRQSVVLLNVPELYCKKIECFRVMKKGLSDKILIHRDVLTYGYSKLNIYSI